MTPEPLVVTTRESPECLAGGLDATLDPRSIENVHYGSIAVVGADGALRAWAGDPHGATFTRSTLKPFQALPFVAAGGPAHYGWTSREVALMCASHSGEPMHTDVVAGMLSSCGCDASELRCGCHVPGRFAAIGRAPPPDATWTPLENNCSGKHAGFLAACRMHDEPVDDYLSPAAPSQRRVVDAVAAVAGVAPDSMPMGVDGCSAPNYALPLERLAHCYAQLAQGPAAARHGEPLGMLFDAMTRHPELVSGTNRSDRALMGAAPGDLVTKIGADGVQAIGVRSAGLGIAIKIADGNRDALYCAVVATLSALGLAGPDASSSRPWLRTTLANARGRPTGRIAPVFALRAA